MKSERNWTSEVQIIVCLFILIYFINSFRNIKQALIMT